MNNLKIKEASACYTGGGIYIYYGRFENGLYFRANDGCDSVAICTEDTGTEEADHNKFYESYMIEELINDEYKKTYNNILMWIIKNNPKGNYLTTELEDRIIK